MRHFNPHATVLTVIVLALIIDQLQQRAERRLALQQQAAQVGAES